MIVKCPDCGVAYHDEDRLTYCPHELIMAAADLEQKKRALSLLERDICFAHQPNGPTHRIRSVGWNGMVTLADMVGEFAPHLFVIATKPPMTDQSVPAAAPLTFPSRARVIEMLQNYAAGTYHAIDPEICGLAARYLQSSTPQAITEECAKIIEHVRDEHAEDGFQVEMMDNAAEAVRALGQRS